MNDFYHTRKRPRSQRKQRNRVPLKTEQNIEEMKENSNEFIISSLKSNIEKLDQKINYSIAQFAQNESILKSEISKKKELVKQLEKAATLHENEDLLLKNKELQMAKTEQENEINIITPTTKLIEDSFNLIKKNYELTKYAYDLLPNETDEIYEIALKMVNLRFSSNLNQRLTNYEQSEAEYQELSEEKETLSSMVNDLTNENKVFEKEIARLTPIIKMLSAERAKYNLEISERNKNGNFTKTDLDIGISGIYNDCKMQKRKEKKNLKLSLQNIFKENQNMHKELISKLEISRGLQENFENTNSLIDEMLENYKKKEKDLQTKYQEKINDIHVRISNLNK